ncbi:MAG: hypothetical protein KatS3mg077_2146 [Candidatus Binatia bacterium]|nr:MAG: hypothetical protein KatS3mg077_2146 [Candidatus Binatia bacterium]
MSSAIAGVAWIVLVLAGTLSLGLFYRRVRELRASVEALKRIETSSPSAIIPRPSWLFGSLERSIAELVHSYHRRLAAAEQERGLLAATLSSMHEAVLVLDERGDVILCNGEAQRLFGEETELRGRPLFEIARQPDLLALVRTSTETGQATQGEVTLADGRFLQVRVAPVAAPRREGTLRLVVARDVTETKRLEVTRRDFVANVSHELRTPLTSIRGYAETLLAGALRDPERARSFVAVIERHAERLTRLVDDLLALSNLELGRATLRLSSVEMPAVVQRVLETFAPQARAKHVTLQCECAPQLPQVRADPDRVEQVLVNLIDNALKYTGENGSIRVRCQVAAVARGTHLRVQRAEGWWVELCVEDTGAGIPSRDLPRLTERFYRVDRARSRELGGTGLGLAIVKHIMQAHGGALRIESTLGRGTTVCVYFPVSEIGDKTSAEVQVKT